MPADELAGLPAGDDTAERALDAGATRAAVALIATLPPDQAEAVLRAVVGQDVVAAATVLGKRPGAVRTAASRGLRTLARPGCKLGWEIEQLAEDLAGLFGPKVDLVSLRAVHLRMEPAVLAEARLLYTAPAARRNDPGG